jgi:ribosomal protein S18 acetylase RimI-like enzyme
MIRAANIFDVPAMLRIDRVAHVSRWSVVSFIRYLFLPYRTRVIKSDGRVVAFAVSQKHLHHLVVLNMAVSLGYHRKSYGQNLLMHVIDHASQLGLRYVLLEVAVNNRQALAFYVRYGFKFNDYLPNYYDMNGVIVDAWRMRYAL